MAASNKPWHRQSVKEVIDYFKVDHTKGLSSQEALKRLAAFGPNLNNLLPDTSSAMYQALVYRDSKLKKITVGSLVVGDIVVIESGDRVPADLRLIRVNSLAVDESNIGGDHLVYKNTFAQKGPDNTVNQKCIAFKDTLVAAGNAVGLVVSTNQSHSIALKSKLIKKPSIKARSLVKKFSKKGLFVQDNKVFDVLKKVNTVIFFGSFDNDFIFSTINKLQLQSNIHSLFIVNSVNQSLYSALPKNVILDYSNDLLMLNEISVADVLKKANIIIDKDGEHFIKIVNCLKNPDYRILAVINSSANSHIISSVDASIVLGQDIKDNVALFASIRAMQVSPNLLTSILYNKNKA